MGLSRRCSATPARGVPSTSRIPGSALDTCGSGIPFSGLGLCSGSSAPSLWGIWNGSLCGGYRRRWRGCSCWWGRRYCQSSRCRRGCCSHWRVWWGASWDLQAEGYRRGEGTDLVAPAGLSPNGNRCPLGSIPCRPQGPPIYTPSPTRIVPPCTGDTRADRYS